jgi:menaquinone-9 beta-reductase
LVEKSVFPRDKVCGDAIGSRVKNILRRIDPLLEKSLEEYPEKTVSRGWKLFGPGGQKVQVEFVNHGYVSRRVDFDNFLFEKVKENRSAECFENTTISEVKIFSEGIAATTSEGKVLTGKLIIGCDGAHSIVEKKLCGSTVDHEHYSGAVRSYYHNVGGIQSDYIEIHLSDKFLPGYFWIFPLKDNYSNIGFGMLSKDIIRKKVDLKKAFYNIIADSPTLNKRFENARQCSQLQGFGLPLGGKQRKISGERFILCGDAASLIDPLNGEGIGNAMYSALIASEQVKKCFAKNDFSSEFLAAYDREIGRKLIPELSKKLQMQRLFNRKWLINMLISAGSRSSIIRNWIGKKL